jgi:hypothetical protein
MAPGSISYDIESEKLISGTLTGAAQTVDLSGPNSGTDVVQVTGTWVGTIVVEGSNDGTNFLAIPFRLQSSNLTVSTITINGAYIVASNGYAQTRVRASAWTSGTAIITTYGSNAPSLVYVDSILRGATDGTQIGNSADRLRVESTQSGTWTVTAAEDKNYGTVGATTLRVAAQIGNATGAADFNFGAASAQTLRVTALLGNASGLIDFNFGTISAQTIRSASQVGNATGAADFNAGASGAQTLRTHANQGAPGTAANAWFEKITDGTDVAKVTANSDLSTSDGLRNGGVQGSLTLTTANTTYEAKVDASRLTNRKSLVITANDDMFWGYDNTVTTSTGQKLAKDQQIAFAVDPDSTFQIWLVAAANSKTARVAESP